MIWSLNWTYPMEVSVSYLSTHLKTGCGSLLSNNYYPESLFVNRRFPIISLSPSTCLISCFGKKSHFRWKLITMQGIFVLERHTLSFASVSFPLNPHWNSSCEVCNSNAQHMEVKLTANNIYFSLIFYAPNQSAYMHLVSIYPPHPPPPFYNTKYSRRAATNFSN